MFLGEDLLIWLLLAMGAAMVAGNVAALVRPRAGDDNHEGDLEAAPLWRSLLMIGLGLVAAVWALASLIG